MNIKKERGKEGRREGREEERKERREGGRLPFIASSTKLL